MRFQARKTAAAALVALLATGCVPLGVAHLHHRRNHFDPHPHGSVVIVKPGHVHSTHCGHYRWRGRWYHSGGHVHGHGCRHHFSGGVWVLH